MNLYTYILKRIFSMIPTLFGITLVVFFLINLAPGSPIEQKIQQIRFGGGESAASGVVNNEVIESLKKQYGFDKPIHIRYLLWLKNLAHFDFGESFSYQEPALDVIISKFPVSMQFGLVSLLLTYLICIPLGVCKAMKTGEKFDAISSFILFVMYSIPSFMLGILLLVIFAGDSFLDIFPLGGLYSDDYEDYTFWGQLLDRAYHFVLPLVSYMIGQFTTLTLLMRNSLLEEIKKDYIRTARAKGLSEKVIYLKHALRNALIPIVTGIGSFISFFFAGSLLIETIFQLDGIGLLSYQAVLERDYNVMMGLIFLQSLLMLVGNLISDLAYVVVDPRIDFK